jgi:hypothetical protein
LVAAAKPGDLQRNPALLLPPCIRSCLDEVWADGIDEDDGYGWGGYVVRYDLAHPMTDDERAHAAAIADAACEPAHPDDIVKELGRLRLMVASRDVGADLDLVFAVYTDELRRYPIDAIREVLRGLGRSHKFWPTVSEIQERLDRLVKPRYALRQTLRRHYEPTARSPDWMPPPTEEEKKAVFDLLAAHGISLDVHGRVILPDEEPITRKDLARVHAETRHFRLPDEDDPRVMARLREMGVEA